MTEIRNVAIIAHVDHGKTTLVDHMLRQTGTFREGQQLQERVMDRDPLERERGITILSKNLSVRWGDARINLVDTPGHADFGGEVERILRMVDGAVILVDAAEGPMPQTRFVTRKALALGLQPVVVINKVDRSDADPARVHDEVLELFMELDATEAQLDAPFLYAVAVQGWASARLGEQGSDLEPLFETIVDTVPAPRVDPEGPFRMLVSTLDHSPYLGRLAIGRIERGRLEVGAAAVLAAPERAAGERARIRKLFRFEGLGRAEVASAGAGEIVAVAGLEGVEIGDTVADPERPEALEAIRVEEPTVSVDVRINDSPFSGQEGEYVTSRQLRDRLMREVETNIALRVEPTASPDTFTVSGRGELHLGILMENMRREGYEFSVSRPRVITRSGPNGTVLEPFEEVSIDLPETMVGAVTQKLGPRKGVMVEMRAGEGGRARLVYHIPSRGLFGYRSEFLTDTRGEGILHHQFLEYRPHAGPIRSRNRGVMVSMAAGESTAFSVWNLQDRGVLFIGPGTPVYDGMIVGEHARPGDLEVNVTKAKKLTNIRAAGADDAILLEPPRPLGIEDALGYIGDDELIEVTPRAVRLRKRHLNASERKKASRASA